MQCKLIHDGLKIIIYIKRKSKYTHTHMCNQILLWNIPLKINLLKKEKHQLKKLSWFVLFHQNGAKKLTRK